MTPAILSCMEDGQADCATKVWHTANPLRGALGETFWNVFWPGFPSRTVRFKMIERSIMSRHLSMSTHECMRTSYDCLIIFNAVRPHPPECLVSLIYFLIWLPRCSYMITCKIEMLRQIKVGGTVRLRLSLGTFLEMYQRWYDGMMLHGGADVCC